MSGQALVIGIGNPLRGDDGVGRLLAQEVGGLCVHQLTPELAADLALADRVLFVDAWLAPERAEPRLRRLRCCAAAGVGSHHLTPATLLALAERLYAVGPVAAELLVPAHAFPHGEGLSSELQSRLPEARKLLRRWLANPEGRAGPPCTN